LSFLNSLSTRKIHLNTYEAILGHTLTTSMHMILTKKANLVTIDSRDQDLCIKDRVIVALRFWSVCTHIVKTLPLPRFAIGAMY
jgi:hypothetical protein